MDTNSKIMLLAFWEATLKVLSFPRERLQNMLSLAERLKLSDGTDSSKEKWESLIKDELDHFDKVLSENYERNLTKLKPLNEEGLKQKLSELCALSDQIESERPEPKEEVLLARTTDEPPYAKTTIRNFFLEPIGEDEVSESQLPTIAPDAKPFPG